MDPTPSLAGPDIPADAPAATPPPETTASAAATEAPPAQVSPRPASPRLDPELAARLARATRARILPPPPRRYGRPLALLALLGFLIAGFGTGFS